MRNLSLEYHRERMRKALAGKATVTPREAFAEVAAKGREYSPAGAEVVCALLASLGFNRGYGDQWTRELGQ